MRTFNVQPTTLGGTVEKLEMGMTGIYSGCRPEACYRIEPDLRPNINETLGQAYTNVPIRAVTWRDTKTTLHNQMEGPHRGGRMDPRLEWTADKARPYTRYTVKTKGPHTLRTQNHTSSSYHGLMFAVRAGKAPIRIEGDGALPGIRREYLHTRKLDQAGEARFPGENAAQVFVVRQVLERIEFWRHWFDVVEKRRRAAAFVPGL